MNNNSIEDILIDKNYNKNKKSGRPVFIIFIILIMIAGLAYGAYYYYVNSKKESDKQLFLNVLSNIDINFFLKNEIYEEISKKIVNNSFEMNNELTFSNNFKNNEYITEDVDYSKYLVNLNMIRNKENEENLNELNLSYSDNNLLNLKIIDNKEYISAFSEEIVNKYVGIKKSNKIDFLVKLGIDSEYINTINNMDNFKENILNSKIELDEKEKKEKINKYINIIVNNIEEKNFSKQEDRISLVKSNSDEVAVQAYKLKLSEEELKTVLINMLTELKNDKEFIQKIIREKDEKTTKEENKVKNDIQNNVIEIPVQETINQTTTNNIIEEQIVEEATNNLNYDSIDESDNNTNDSNLETPIISIQEISNTEEDIVQQSNLQPIGTSELQELQEDVVNESDNLENLEQTIPDKINTTFEIEQNEDIKKYLEEINKFGLNNIVLNFLLGIKTETTLEEVQRLINQAIEDISNQEGNGIEITLYVSEVATEKINVILPDLSTFDIEFEKISENEKKVIITYLYEEDAINYGENDVAVYSAENTLPQESQSITEKQTNGVKVELKKNINDASASIDIVFNIIQNKEINQKVSLNLETKGTVNSKNFNNDCVVTYSTNDGEVKTNLKNKINFDKVLDIEDMNQDNCLFLDLLNDEEFSATIISIIDKIEDVYNKKREDLNLIDTNVQAPDITQNEQNREELRNLLVTTVSIQMGEAISRGEEYSIQNLQDLQIEGHIVNVYIINDVAEISVDGIKFKIDSNFNLTDA